MGIAGVDLQSKVGNGATIKSQFLRDMSSVTRQLHLKLHENLFENQISGGGENSTPSSDRRQPGRWDGSIVRQLTPLPGAGTGTPLAGTAPEILRNFFRATKGAKHW